MKNEMGLYAKYTKVFKIWFGAPTNLLTLRRDLDSIELKVFYEK